MPEAVNIAPGVLTAQPGETRLVITEAIPPSLKPPARLDHPGSNGAGDSPIRHRRISDKTEKIKQLSGPPTRCHSIDYCTAPAVPGRQLIQDLGCVSIKGYQLRPKLSLLLRLKQAGPEAICVANIARNCGGPLPELAVFPLGRQLSASQVLSAMHASDAITPLAH